MGRQSIESQMLQLSISRINNFRVAMQNLSAKKYYTFLLAPVSGCTSLSASWESRKYLVSTTFLMVFSSWTGASLWRQPPTQPSPLRWLSHSFCAYSSAWTSRSDKRAFLLVGSVDIVSLYTEYWVYYLLAIQKSVCGIF